MGQTHISRSVFCRPRLVIIIQGSSPSWWCYRPFIDVPESFSSFLYLRFGCGKLVCFPHWSWCLKRWWSHTRTNFHTDWLDCADEDTLDPVCCVIFTYIIFTSGAYWDSWLNRSEHQMNPWCWLTHLLESQQEKHLFLEQKAHVVLITATSYVRYLWDNYHKNVFSYVAAMFCWGSWWMWWKRSLLQFPKASLKSFFPN